MFATLVIGLREGLEAVLMVGIIALFLRRSGKSLKPMGLGVALAVFASVAIAVALQLSAASLPQAQQEGMEAIIGLLTVVMVTGMVLWMSKHAAGLKKELESSARAASGKNSSLALAAMAFLAVFKEGVETAFFLLAAFQSAQNALLASLGALAGLGIAVVLGVLFFKGVVKINLGKFFGVSTFFLVLVAGGILLGAFRSAVEAGWVHFGQDHVANIQPLAPYGSVRSAILTGVFGIPTNISVLDVVVWLAYVVPMLAMSYWPRAWRPRAASRRRVFLTLGATLAAAAVAVFAISTASLASLTPRGSLNLSPSATDAKQTLAANPGSSPRPAKLPATVRLERAGNGGSPSLAFEDGTRLPLTRQGSTELDGREVDYYTAQDATAQSATALDKTGQQGTRLDLTDLSAATGGRLPVGFTRARTPGPFKVSAARDERHVEVWAYRGSLVKAASNPSRQLTLVGGGLRLPRQVSVPQASAVLENTGTGSGRPASALATSAAPAEARLFAHAWSTGDAQQEDAMKTLDAQDRALTDAPLWRFLLPLFLLVWAAVALYAALVRPKPVTP